MDSTFTLLTVSNTILTLFMDVLDFQLPAPFPKIFDCREIDYCCDYSKSCIKRYEEVGGTNNYARLVEEYPCCLCSSLNNKTCVCGKGGFVIRDLTLKLPPDNPTVQIGTYLIVTPYTNFQPKAAKCVMQSDCTDAEFCSKKCYELGVEKVSDVYRCCSCGPPLDDCCENCSCATNTTYARIRANNTQFHTKIGIFQVSITEGPLLTTSAQDLFYDWLKSKNLIPS